jgi:anaerobic ribonucleoside-triphosphate reductase activating protein
MSEQSLRIHDFLPASRANGPGWRAVIWVQGCSLNCPGCFNPETHAPTGGESVPVDALVRRIVALAEPSIEGVSGGERGSLDARHRRNVARAEFAIEGISISGGERGSLDARHRRNVARAEFAIEGISISGGEPLEQARPLLALLRRIKAKCALSVVLFTGYSWAEIQGWPIARDVLTCVDVLIAGRYDASQPIREPLRSSANQTLHRLTDRYTEADLQAIPPAEIILTVEGEVLLSGADPVKW